MNKLFSIFTLTDLSEAQKKRFFLILGFGLLLTMTDLAFAQAMPWETPLCKIMNSMNGTVVRAVAIIAIVITGLVLALGETGGIFKLLLQLVFGLAVALLANQWLGFIDPTSASFNC